MNKQAMMARLRVLAQHMDVPMNVLLSYYFFESFLKRMANHTIMKQWVLKGGFYLSSLFGLRRRSTLDLDFWAGSAETDLETLRIMLVQSCSIKDENGVCFDVGAGRPLWAEAHAKGCSFSLIGHLENIRVPFSIDIVFGDPINPPAIHYVYQPLIGDPLTVRAYPLETILAEKYHTCLARGTENSRFKDFYDIYAIITTFGATLDPVSIRNAVRATFAYRDSSLLLNDADRIYGTIIQDPRMEKQWHIYGQKHAHARDLSFSEVLSGLVWLMNILK